MSTLPKYVPFGRIAELNLPAHPDAARIALDYGRGLFSDVAIKVFNHRKVLARCVRIAERGGVSKWRPVVPLTDGEGY